MNHPNQSSSEEKVTYTQKTERLQTWVQAIKSLTPIIWAVVIIVVIVPLLGQLFISRAFPNSAASKNQDNSFVIVQPSLDWSKLDAAMSQALRTAHASAENYASQELDSWVEELLERVDRSFLDWYFSYFNQKQIEYKSIFVQLYSGAAHLLNSQNPTAAEKVAEVVTKDFQTEFAKRVLMPQTSQLRLERLTQQTVNYYLNELQGSINAIPIKYQIPQADWDRYLSEIAISINDTEGHLSNLSLKVLAGGGAYLAVKPLVAPLALKVGSKVVSKLAGKAGAKIATKTGVSLVGKLGAGLLDCTIGVGIIIWDVWDTYHTANIEKPILRENLADYLQEVKFSLLDNPENGIMTAIAQLESKIVEAIQ